MAKELILKEGEVDTRGIVPINRRSFKDSLRAYLRKPWSFVLFLLICLGTAISAAAVLWVLLYTFIQGVPNLRPSLFAWHWTTENRSMMPALINTLVVALFSLLIAGVIGVFAAIFMVEYAKSTNVFVKIVRVAAETLSGIPSIVYGIFGMILFVGLFGWGESLISGILTMTLMVMPLIMRTTEEALLAVPDSYREGSYGLGAGRLRTIFRVVLPSAMPGILSGVILGVGRIVGETAALIYTAGSVTGVPDSLMSSGRTLAVHMYALLSEGLYTDEAYATAVVLLVLVFIINRLSAYVANKIQNR